MRPIDQNAMDAILRYVNDYYRENHTSPTIRQISEATGVSVNVNEFLYHWH